VAGPHVPLPSPIHNPSGWEKVSSSATSWILKTAHCDMGEILLHPRHFTRLFPHGSLKRVNQIPLDFERVDRHSAKKSAPIAWPRVHRTLGGSPRSLFDRRCRGKYKQRLDPKGAPGAVVRADAPKRDPTHIKKSLALGRMGFPLWGFIENGGASEEGFQRGKPRRGLRRLGFESSVFPFASCPKRKAEIKKARRDLHVGPSLSATVKSTSPCRRFLFQPK